MAVSIPVVERFQPAHATALAVLWLSGSVALSLWASLNALVYLPAADVWQHQALIASAAAGTVDIVSLWEKHNGLHFIPVPKLAYALDLIWFAGSGRLTAGLSGVFTILVCLLGGSLIASTLPNRSPWKPAAGLMAASWLAAAIQWESFVNPANLQWSGLSAGLLLAATGLRQPFSSYRALLSAAGLLLATGCGAPWWLLAIALAWSWLPGHRRLSAATALAALVVWDLANAFWLQRYTPLPLLLLASALPVSPELMAATTAEIFQAPGAYYSQWLASVASFLAAFCMPPLADWVSGPWVGLLATGPLLLGFVLMVKPPARRDLAFLLTVTLLMALAAAVVRGPFAGAYTGRFANTGLLFIVVVFSLALSLAGAPRHRQLWWLTAVCYSVLLGVSNWRAAGDIVADSNQRRLSQIAYALDIRDMRATSETPYAPLMAQSHQVIEAQKDVLSQHSKGIYHSREYRIYRGTAALPALAIPCDYSDIAVRPLRDDPDARKLTGQARASDGSGLGSVLVLDSRQQHIGFGIKAMAGKTPAEQWQQPARFAAFLRAPGDGTAVLVAYDARRRCQPFSITLP